jgi:hypothetical protein
MWITCGKFVDKNTSYPQTDKGAFIQLCFGPKVKKALKECYNYFI